ncbi:MAG: CsbD family protein [Polyangiaceae bacterium]
MNWDIIEGKWDQLKGQLKSSFAKLTDDDVRNLSGKKDVLIGKVQERYGVQKDEAERRIDAWLDGLGNPPPKH